MLNLSPIVVTYLNQCVGFEITDTTDYNQLPAPVINGLINVFQLANFEAGIRIIQVTNPDGTSQLYCSYFPLGSLSGLTVYQFNTNITLANNTDYQQTFYSTEQGNFTVTILSIPGIINPNDDVDQTNAAVGDLVCVNFSGTIQIYVAIVNNPTQDVGDSTQWNYVTITQAFQIYNLSLPISTTNPESIPTDYLNTITATQDCYLRSLECVLANIDCGFCCGCCDDLFKNQNAIRAIKASLLVLELNLLEIQAIQPQLSSNQTNNQNFLSSSQLAQTGTTPAAMAALTPVTFIPTDYYLNKVCTYSKCIWRLCNCCKAQPCAPCDDTSETESNQNISQQNIISALNTIFNNNLANNLNNQVMLGKKLCCMDRKQFLALIVSLAAFDNNISLSAPNYNCLDTILGFTASDTNGEVIVNSQGSVLVANTGTGILPIAFKGTITTRQNKF